MKAKTLFNANTVLSAINGNILIALSFITKNWRDKRSKIRMATLEFY